MSPVQRHHVFHTFMSRPDMGTVVIQSVSVQDINTGCVLQCTLRAMARAVRIIGARGVLVDGCHAIPLKVIQKSVPRGDQQSISIALASILAKVVRDQEMMRLSIPYPLFHWDQNKGYGTLLHRKAIQRHGLTSHHRTLYCRRALNEMQTMT